MTERNGPPASAAHAFVESLEVPVLDPDDVHHFQRVLRLRDGELVTVSDGEGSWRPCRIARGSLEPDGPVCESTRPEPTITIAFAVTKADRPEWTVQKLTELGVDRIVPVMADHTVVRWDEARAARNVRRLRAVARSAAMQSRRVWSPIVDDVVASTQLAECVPGLALAHPGGGVVSLNSPAIAVGPEGGWSARELGHAPLTVDLGENTLRAETAAVAAGVLLTALRAGMVTGISGKNA
ncbi:MAG TPA: 16S rRNA (uracil(1498)-N(3))-methyltransferase [Acidimicrobiales bacterium]|nr:16S rRNA (uracil(1498)-N(3))-methyltransferase [Acidimicrobiales bacterium]